MDATPTKNEPERPLAAAGGEQDFVPPGIVELCLAFLQIGLMGFGGLAPAAYHVIVEKKRWYNAREYVELFAICSILPGGNILNASIIIGNRFQGAMGALLALLALLLVPLLLLVLLAVTYDSFSGYEDVRAATAGAASAAAGLIIGTAGKLIRGVEKSATSLVFGLATLFAIGVMRFPLQLTMLVLAPLAIGWGFYCARQVKKRGGDPR